MPARTCSHRDRVAAPDTRRSRWLREPLLHFVLLGGLLFAVDHLVVGRTDGASVIVVGAEVDDEARQLFKTARGREPNAEELDALRRAWLDNEVLYREGLALQVDRGDKAIRERVIFKALSVVDAGIERPSVDEKMLREWFERHRARYDEPGRYDFQEAVLAGDSSEAALRAFVERLNTGTPGDVDAGLRVFKGRPASNIVQSYGADFAAAMDEAPVGQWRAVLSREGWRAVRLDAAAPPKPADFERLRGVVLQDWTDATMAERRTDAVRALARKYAVKHEVVGK